MLAPAIIFCEKAEESSGESSIASSLGEEKVEKVGDAKMVTIGGGESEVGGIVEKCEEDDLKTEPIDKEWTKTEAKITDLYVRYTQSVKLLIMCFQLCVFPKIDFIIVLSHFHADDLKGSDLLRWLLDRL